MAENTINQRLKNLIEALKLNIRSFSKAYDLHEGNIRNYVDRGSKPPAEFIALLVQSIDDLNPKWLLLGEGPMFTTQAAESSTIYQKNHSGTNIANTQGATLNYATQEDCEKDITRLNTEIELLRSQLKDKELIIELLQKQK